MAHNLRIVDGKAAMAYTGETPWHELGTKMDGPMTVEEALTAGGLNYNVLKLPSFLEDGRKLPMMATVAEDTGAILGMVGEGYEVVQNRTALAFADDLAGIGQGQIMTVGALGKGERVWMLLRMPEIMEIVPGDEILPFILLTNSHDGSSSVEARYTAIRVVCDNTLHMALTGSKAVIKLRHTKTVAQRLAIAATLLSGYQDHLGQFADCMKRLQRVRINDELITAFEKEMFGDIDDTPEGRGRTLINNNIAAFENLLITGRGTEIPGVAGTLYGMLNAYTEWSDYYSTVRGTADRTNAIVFGNAAQKKSDALQFALALSAR